MSEKSYIPQGVFLLCDKGVLPTPLLVTSAPTVDFLGTNVATEMDRTPGTNIIPFGICTLLQSPCTPLPTFWSPVQEDVVAHGARPLLEDSKLTCSRGGSISVFMSLSAALLRLAGSVSDVVESAVDGAIKTVEDKATEGFDAADGYLKKLPPPLANYAREEMGKAEGVWEGASGLVTGVWGLAKMANHLQQKAANAVVFAIDHPAEAGAAIQQAGERGWSAATNVDNWHKIGSAAYNSLPPVAAYHAGVWMSDPAHREQAWNVTKAAYTKASTYMAAPRNRGKFIGRAGFEIAVAVFTGGAGEAANVGKVGEVANALEKGGELANALEKSAEATKTGRVLTGAAEEASDATRLSEEAAEQAAKKGEGVDGAARENQTCVKDPIDVATGAMLFDAIDIELPGPVPFVWLRTWYSTSARRGPLGHGWHHSYDQVVWQEANGSWWLRQGEGRLVSFAPLTAENNYYAFNRAEQLELRATAAGYGVFSLREQLTYQFRPAPAGSPLAADGFQVLAAVENTHGQAVRLAYSPHGHLSGITDSAGRAIGVRTDALGRILALDLPHPAGTAGTFAAVQYSYDELGNLTTATDAEGHAMRFTYAGHLLVQKTFRNGFHVYFEYDELKRCTHTWGDENYYNGRFEYNEGHTVLRSEEPAARQQYWHKHGLVTHHLDPVGALHEWHYNAHGELELARDPLGQATLYDYDARGHCVGVTYPDGARVHTSFTEQGLPVGVTDALGGTWQWAYDAHGQLLTRTDPLGAVTTYEYDEQGHLSKRTDALGQATHLRYDAQHNLAHIVTADGAVRSRHYDALGRLVGLTDASGHTQRRGYDRLGQLTEVQEADGTRRTLAYDGEGNVVRATEGAREVEFTFTPAGQLAQRRQAGQQVQFGYNREGQLTHLVNEAGETYCFRLNAAGQVVEEEGFDGLLRRYTRDAAGRVTHVQRPAGRSTAYSYDAAGHITEVVHNGTERASYRYRLDGALVEAATETTTVQVERDALGRVVGEGQNGVMVASRYDALGQRTAVSSSLGAQVSMEHDALGRLTQLQAGAWRSVLERDAEGLELHRRLSGGVRTSWQRDALGRPTSQRISGAGGQAERQRRYHWHETDELVSLDDSLTGLTHYSYDTWGNLTGGRYADGSEDVRQPDAVGNLFRTQARSDRRYGQGGQLREANGTRYKYDEEGNLLRKTLPTGEVWQYRWDGAGQLANVKRPDGYAVTFSYDALGRRVSKRFRGRVTKWVWDADKPLHEWTELEVGPGAGSAGEVLTWLFEQDSFAPVAKLTAQGAYSVVCDHLGTPLELYDERGAKTWQAQLDSYGAVRAGKGRAQDCPFRYQGQYEDVETGLYYNRFRYYDPEIGQYISQDPLGLEGGMTLYSYVQNPNSWVDAFGLAPCRAVNGRFQKAQTAADEAKSLPEFSGRTKGNIRAGLKKRGYTRIKSVNGDETWVRPTPDGKLAVARLDAPVVRSTPTGYADEVAHAHKEIANGYHIDPANGQGYTNGGIKKFDDLGNQTNNAGLQHIPTKN